MRSETGGVGILRALTSNWRRAPAGADRPTRTAWVVARLPAWVVATVLSALTPLAAMATGCGEVVEVATREGSTTRYVLSLPPAGKLRGALVLLAGGGGHLDVDDGGCPRALKGNSLVRTAPLFRDAGFATALVDAPSSHTGVDGLGGFRLSVRHAEDLGRVMADLRTRVGAPVWLIGTSRGSISAANAASRLTGPAAPDGLVLTSALTSGHVGGQKDWVADTVFDLPLEAIRMPVLVVGHAADACIRTPPERMQQIVARTASPREQVVTLSGGPESAGPASVQACEGRSPHGFIGQEEEVVSGIVRFIGGGRF